VKSCVSLAVPVVLFGAALHTPLSATKGMTSTHVSRGCDAVSCPEYGSDSFLRNVGKFLPDYTEPHTI
jgi:hypothetical protein